MNAKSGRFCASNLALIMYGMQVLAEVWYVIRMITHQKPASVPIVPAGLLRVVRQVVEHSVPQPDGKSDRHAVCVQSTKPRRSFHDVTIAGRHHEGQRIFGGTPGHVAGHSCFGLLCGISTTNGSFTTIPYQECAAKAGGFLMTKKVWTWPTSSSSVTVRNAP